MVGIVRGGTALRSSECYENWIIMSHYINHVWIICNLKVLIELQVILKLLSAIRTSLLSIYLLFLFLRWLSCNETCRLQLVNLWFFLETTLHSIFITWWSELWNIYIYMYIYVCIYIYTHVYKRSDLYMCICVYMLYILKRWLAHIINIGYIHYEYIHLFKKHFF